MSEPRHPIGTVAFMAIAGRLQAVRVIGTEQSKLLVEDPEGTTHRISISRLLWSSDRKAQDKNDLCSVMAEVNADAAQWPAQAAWDHLCDEEEPSDWEPETFRESLPENLRTPNLDALLFAVFHDRMRFRLRRGMVQPTPKAALKLALDEQAHQAHLLRQNEQATAALMLWLEHGSRPECDLERAEAVAQHLAWLEEVAAHDRDAPPETVDAVVKLLNGLGVEVGRAPLAYQAFELLVSLGIYNIHENMPVRRAKVSTTFSQAALDEAKRTAKDGKWQAEPRTDFTHLHTVAIDAEHTKEVDDAFAVSGNELIVFIADVTSLIRAGGPLDKVAADRLTSLYLPTGTIPMLPAAIGQEAGSLQAGERRPCLAMRMRFDGAGALANFSIELGVCRVDEHATYIATDALLTGQSSELEGQTAATVQTASRWMAHFSRQRASKGALLLQRKEVLLSVVDDAVSVEAVNANGPGRQLVGEMMVACCIGAANWCDAREIPILYRCQAAPNEPMSWTAAELREPSQQAAILRRLKPTSISVTKGPHFTLGTDGYTQVTSPLRRYQDLVVHQQIRAHLLNEEFPYDEAALLAIVERGERRLGDLRRVEIETRRYWTLEYLRAHPAKRYVAHVLRRINRGWLVQLDEVMQQAILRTKRKVKPGVQLMVAVVQVDARRNRLVVHEPE